MTWDRRVAARTGRSVVGALLAAAVALGGIAPADARADDDGSDLVTTPVTVVQANLNKDMGAAKFDADIAAVFAQQPDIVTFNEVYKRDDAQLAPPGYQMFRTPGPRTGWAPVVWKSSVWSAVGQGTWQISDRPKKYQNKPGMVGVRYANWATLVNASGQVVSVISAHIAPNDKRTAELLLPSLRRLRSLATTLGALGPVVLGGDLNMGYHSSRYNPRPLAAAGLTSTWDLTGSSFPTHKGGGTIDYIYLGPTGAWSVTDQYPVVLNSDHRMIVAHLQLLAAASDDVGPRFAAGTVVARLRGTPAQRRAIRTLQMKAIRATPSGAAIHVASPLIQGGALLRVLAKAKARGVNVTVITERRKLSQREVALRKVLGGNSSRSSYFVKVPGIWTVPSGKRPRRVPRLDPTVLLISKAGATPAFAMVADSNLSYAALRPQRGKRQSRATVTTTPGDYDRLYRRYLTMIGRSY